MPLTPSEIAANLPALLGLRNELDQLIFAHQTARNDGDLSEPERRNIRRMAGQLLRAATPVLASIIIDVVD
tara:strand:+ start:684 stop:896 length:213 start_codon:yes stop_codon:yes gene_type:complete